MSGNQLGDSTEEVEEVMTSIGRINTLAPFDDNEEPDSDDEEEGVESDNDEGEEQEDTSDLALQIKGMGLSKESPLLKDSSKTNGEHTEVREYVENSFQNTP